MRKIFHFNAVACIRSINVTCMQGHVQWPNSEIQHNFVSVNDLCFPIANCTTQFCEISPLPTAVRPTGLFTLAVAKLLVATYIASAEDGLHVILMLLHHLFFYHDLFKAV